LHHLKVGPTPNLDPTVLNQENPALERLTICGEI